MTTPKSPEQVVREVKDLLNQSTLLDSQQKKIEDAFRSSMASLLCYMAERMPEKEEPLLDGGKRIEWHYGKSGMGDIEKFVNNGEIVGRNQGIDDCRNLLIEEARKITGENKTEEEAEKIQALSNMLMFCTGKKPKK